MKCDSYSSAALLPGQFTHPDRSGLPDPKPHDQSDGSLPAAGLTNKSCSQVQSTSR